MALLRIQLLGDFRVEYHGDPIRAVDRVRLQLLLAYLLLHRHTPQLRQRIAFQFWPDSSEPQARNNLRKALSELRQAWPDIDQFLHIDARTVQWRPDASYSLDITEFEELIAQAKALIDNPPAQRVALEAAVALYHGDLLPGSYDDWIIPERERLRQAFIKALESLVWRAEDQRDYAAAIHYANHLLRYDPLHEPAYRQLMRCHALNGEHAGALRVYHTCVTVLRRELGVEPSEEIQQAYARLLEHEVPAVLRSQRSIQLSVPLNLVGREREWHTLRTAWEKVAQGHANFCLISGEAGIGKTRLAEELLAWTERQGIATARTRSYAAAGGLAYTPVIEWLRSTALQVARHSLDDVWLTELARLLPELLVERPDLAHPRLLTDRWQRQRLFEALARGFLTAPSGSPRPKLLVIDDLQWCDVDTLEWLRYLLHFAQREAEHQRPVGPLLIVGTTRTEEVNPEHPLNAVLLDLRSTGQVTELVLGPLSAGESAELAAEITHTPLDEAASAQLYTQTEGNPLFIVETLRAGLRDQRLETGDGTTVLQSSVSGFPSLPPKVQAVIQYRLAQLSPASHELARLAATIGRAFGFVLLQAAGDRSESELVGSLDELWQRGIIRAQGGQSYDFSHDRIREVAYTEISPVQRPLLHRRVAQALEQIYADDLDPVSAQLAVHYEQAGQPAQAIGYYQRAAEVARCTYANEEAIAHLTQGLALLGGLPDTPARSRQELALQIALGPLLMAVRGFSSPDVVNAYAQARVLCERTGEQAQLFPVLWGLWMCYFSRAEHQQARTLGEELLVVAQNEHNSALLLEAHHALWTSLSYLGDFAAAHQHCSEGLALYDPQQHFPLTFHYGGHDAGVCCRDFHGPVLWCLGYPNQALQSNQEALILAEQLAHPFSQALAQYWLCMVHQFRREDQAAQAHAEAAIKLAGDQGFPYILNGATSIRGWALAVQGHAHEGVALIRKGLTDNRATGSAIDETHLLALLAEAYGLARQPVEGLQVLAEARSILETTGERYCEAELYRLQGVLTLQGADPNLTSSIASEAETCFHQAIEIARAQEARSFELRAVMSLCRLWQSHGKRTAAHDRLAEIYGWFSEGFDTADLQDAQSLLAELS